MAAAQPLFLTPPPPPPRHLAELRIDTAPSVVAFSAPPCDAGAGRKRRCLVPGSSVRKRMLLDLCPFDPAPPSPLPPSPMTPSAGGSTPVGSEAPRALSCLVPQGSPPTPVGGAAKGAFAILTVPERSNEPTGPTARGGFLFAASTETARTPTGSNATSGGVSAVASPTPTDQLLTPTGSSATSGFVAASTNEPTSKSAGSGAGASAKPADTGTGSGGFAFPSPAGRETTTTPPGPATLPFLFTASRLPTPLHKSGDRSRKRPLPNLHVDTTALRPIVPQQHQQCTPPPYKVAKTDASPATGEASRSSTVSALTPRLCCSFFASPPKAVKQEAKNASCEVSRSPAGSSCTTSPARLPSPDRPSKPEREVEVSSVACRGAEVVVRVTCKCGVHEEFTFDHRP